MFRPTMEDNCYAFYPSTSLTIKITIYYHIMGAYICEIIVKGKNSHQDLIRTQIINLQYFTVNMSSSLLGINSTSGPIF